MGRPVIDAHEEWKEDKEDVLCRLIGHKRMCNCPGDENGGYPEKAICFLAAQLIERLTKEYSEQR